MAAFETFPIRIKPSEQSFHLMPAVKQGPILPDGRMQRVAWAGPHWIARVSYQLAEAWEVREVRAYVTKMNGGANEFIMPVHDRAQAPWPTGVLPGTSKPVVEWDDNREWATTFNRRHIKVRATADQPAGYTYLEVENILGGEIRRGNHFSITDRSGRPRLYQIDEVPRGITQGQSGIIRFNPPLRAKVYDNQYLDMDDPACTMTLAEVDSGRVFLSGGQPARAELTLRESFGGF